MRVLVTTDTVGGVWTFTQELAAGLLEFDCRVTLVGLGGEPSREQRRWSAKMEEDWGDSFCFQSVHAPLEWMQENGRAYADAEPALLLAADEFQPDVVHLNQFCFGALPLCAGKVVTAHSDVMSWAACSRSAPLPRSPWLDRYRLLVQSGLDGADAVVAPTRWMLKTLSQYLRLPQERHVITNGRKIGPVEPTQRRLQAVTAGRLWDEGKNISILANIESPVPIFIAGQAACEESSAPPLAGAVQTLGWLSEQELLALFRESAIYICTSRYEPFGLAPLEAAMCGCAVLANDIQSLREVWEDGALYFRDADSLTKLLCGLCSDRDLLATAQSRSSARAQRFSREAMASAYLSLYREVTAPKRGLVHVA